MKTTLISGICTEALREINFTCAIYVEIYQKFKGNDAWTEK